MKNMKLHIGLFAALAFIIFKSTTAVNLWQSSWFDDDIFEEFDHVMTKFRKNIKKQMQTMRESFASIGPSKEEYKTLKEAKKKLNQIKPEVSKDENTGNVIVTFNIESLNKDNISKISIDENQKFAFGTISTDHGKIEYYVYPEGIYLKRSIEIKKEYRQDNSDNKVAKTETEEKTAKKEKSEPITHTFTYFGDISSISESFPVEIDVTSIDAVTKDSKFMLILTPAPKKYKEVTPREL